MKLIKLFFFILIIFSDSFCGPVFSKQQPTKSKISIAGKKRILLKELIEKVIKTRADINGNYKLMDLDSFEYPLLYYAVDFRDLESVELLLKNGADPSVKYNQLVTNYEHFERIRRPVLHYVSSRLYCKLIPEDYEKYKQIQKKLIFAGADTLEWNLPDQKLLDEYRSKLKEELNQTDILLPPLRNMVLEYLV